MLASVFRLAGFLAVTVAAANPASAQYVNLNAPSLVKKPFTPSEPLKAGPTVWPRLDPGAIFCRTSDDLERHAANLTARSSGGSAMPADCRIISQPTGISIISRQGSGRTQVKISGGDNAAGWTDAWLPDKAPVAAR